MIFKYFETEKINLEKTKLFLLYGKNSGLIKETINKIKFSDGEIFQYDEKEILENEKVFFENILVKSLFDKNKTIIINRSTDKILKVINEIFDKSLENILIIITSENLEKKSKLRSFFEKEKNLVCIPFYPDTEKTLLKLAMDFFKNEKIPISQINLNQILNKNLGDRENLLNELKKIKYFVKNGKKITTESLSKLINLTEDYSTAELVDNCLAKNKNKTFTILNENNFKNEDCIAILRIFLSKTKRILTLAQDYEKNKNIDLTISDARPPIFWKDKEIVKHQIINWNIKKLKKLIFEINEIEILIKKNLNFGVHLLYNFIIKQTLQKFNNKI